MPQTRPRGLTGSVTTGRTADLRAHTRALFLFSHTLTLTHTHTQSEVGRVGGGGGSVREGGREAWRVRERGMVVGWDVWYGMGDVGGGGNGGGCGGKWLVISY